MKRRLSMLLIVFMLITSVQATSYGASITSDMPVPEFSGAGLDRTTANIIPGYLKGYELLVNSYFNDLEGSTYLEDVTRMSALGVVKKQGDMYFRPEEAITGYEALQLLVRLAGREAVVQQRVLDNSAGMSVQAVTGLFNEEYLAEANTLNILTNDEERNLTSPVSREVFGAWIARTIGLTPTYGDQSNIFGFNDWGEVTPLYRSIIESLMTTQIMSAGNDGNFRPKGTVSRGEAASILAEASKQVYGNLGITEYYGLVTAVDGTNVIENGENISQKTIYVQNVDGTLTGLRMTDNKTTSQKRNMVVYKNAVSDARALAIGDEIEYLVRNGEVIYANAVTTDALIEKLTNVDETKKDTITYFGTIHDIITTQRWIGGQNVETTRVRVMNFDGEIFDITVDTDLYTGIKNDVVVFKDKAIGGIAGLEIGDQIQYVVSGTKNVIYINAQAFDSYKVSGTVRYVITDTVTGEKRLTIFGYDDIIREFPVADWTSVTINSRYGTLEDLISGQDVKLLINKGYIVDVDSETFTDNPAYIPEEGKIRMGEVFQLFNDGVLVKLNSGEMYQYKIDDDVAVIKGGNTINFRALKEGDKVKLYFDTIYTDKVSRVEVEGIERLVKHVYKGQLAEVNEATGMITLNRAMYLKNDSWTVLDDYTKEIKMDAAMEIFAGNTAVPVNKLLRNYKNNTVYVVVEDHYGVEQGTKLAIKTNGELVTSDSIKRLDKPISSFEMNNKMNVAMTEGTIILKDGKLVGQQTLGVKDKVVVVAEYASGINQANVIKIVTARDDIFSNVYVGNIEYTGPNYFSLKNYAGVTNNMFDDVEDEVSDRFYTTTDTIITDVTNYQNPKTLTPNQLFNGSYGASENEDKNSKGLDDKRYYAFVVENEDDEVIQMNIRFKGLIDGQNIDDNVTKDSQIAGEINEVTESFIFTRGIVEEVDDYWNRIKMTDSNDWTGDLGEWTVNTVDTYFEYEEVYTIFIKNDHEATYKDVKPGNQLYIMRIKEQAYVVFIEED
ncbi:MAG: S-layer homology domain-containing protein [Clostridia bacterium]|nr:S-layer homology domain-containing protein [Clostridia bacterium]